jgi:hypothetical protein
MSTSPKRPVSDPLITRHYEPSRLQYQSLTCAYERVTPIASRRPGSPRCRAGDPSRAGASVAHLSPSIAGA